MIEGFKIKFISDLTSLIKKDNFSHVITIIIFSETVPIFLTELLQYFSLIYIFLLFYIIISIVVPWIYIYTKITKFRILIIFLTSISSLFFFTLVYKVSSAQIELILYLIFLKTMVVGLSSVSKSFILIYLDNPRHRKDFQFDAPSSIKFDYLRNQEIKLYLLGVVIFLIFFPIILLMSLGLILTLK